MNLPMLVMASIMFSILSIASYHQSSFILDIKNKELETQGMKIIKDAIIRKYESTGNIETDISVLQDGYPMNLLDQKDLSGSDFVILNNSGVPFSFNGSPNIYRGVIVAAYKDGLDSQINSNVFYPINSENFYLITQSDIDNSLRGLTKLNVSKCNIAASNYINVEGSLPSTVLDLISKSYASGRDVVDSFGSNLIIDSSGMCYSKGVNGIDDGKSLDDIF